jgi:hypothetical protein
MKSTLLDQAGAAIAARKQRDVEPKQNNHLALEDLSRAVGEHALLQAEIDHKMATRIVAMGEDLRAAKEDIRSLRGQIEQLIQGLSQGLALAHPETMRATAPDTFRSSVAKLRSR